MTMMNVGGDTRPDGFYRVRYKGQWMFAKWEKTALGKGWWMIPGNEYEKLDEDFDELYEEAIDPYPIRNSNHKIPNNER